MSQLCELPFDIDENCSQTLEETFEPFSSTLRVIWMIVTFVLFVGIVPFCLYYLCYMRPKEVKGPVRNGKSLLALASPTILIFSFCYGSLGFFWRNDAGTDEGKLVFMTLMTPLILGLNSEVLSQVALCELMPFYTKKKTSAMMIKISISWQVFAVIASNSIIYFGDLSFSQLLILIIWVCSLPQLFLVPYNIMVCSDFRTLLTEMIQTSASTGRDRAELEVLYSKVSKTLTFFRTGVLMLTIDALVFIPFFQDYVPYVIFQTTVKLSFATGACLGISQFFSAVIKKEMAKAINKKVSILDSSKRDLSVTNIPSYPNKS